MHIVEPSRATSPGPQGMHTVPLRRAPAGQRSHRVRSGEGVAPDGHSTHVDEPRDAYSPASQGTQAVVFERFPASQTIQLPRPAPTWPRLRSHELQRDEPYTAN